MHYRTPSSIELRQRNRGGDRQDGQERIVERSSSVFPCVAVSKPSAATDLVSCGVVLGIHTEQRLVHLNGSGPAVVQYRTGSHAAS